jgi:hypothetical protein
MVDTPTHTGTCSSLSSTRVVCGDGCRPAPALSRPEIRAEGAFLRVGGGRTFLDDLNVMGSPCMIDGRGVGCSTKTHLWILFTTVGDAVYTRCIQTPHYRT